jgi:hypothetical protein
MLNDIPLLVYIIIVVFLSLYHVNDVERLTQIPINSISVYSSFISFVASF